MKDEGKIVPMVTNITKRDDKHAINCYHFRLLGLDILNLPKPGRPSSLLTVMLCKSKNTSKTHVLLTGALLFSCGKVIPLGELKFPIVWEGNEDHQKIDKLEPAKTTPAGSQPASSTAKPTAGANKIKATTAGNVVSAGVTSGKVQQVEASSVKPDPATISHILVQTQPLDQNIVIPPDEEAEEEDETLGLVLWSEKHTRLQQIEPLGMGEDSELYVHARFTRNLKDKTKPPRRDAKEQASFCPSSVVYKVRLNTS